MTLLFVQNLDFAWGENAAAPVTSVTGYGGWQSVAVTTSCLFLLIELLRAVR